MTTDQQEMMPDPVIRKCRFCEQGNCGTKGAEHTRTDKCRYYEAATSYVRVLEKLKAANATLDSIRNIATTNNESKASFIARVINVLEKDATRKEAADV